MIFTHNFKIEFLHINNDKTLKDKSLLFFLENIATRHSDFCGYGIDYILDNNQGWILLDWNLKIFERPKYGEMLEINTWISEITKLFCYRNFEIKSNGIKDDSGQLISMECLECIDSNSSQKTMITNDKNCFIKYKRIH